MQTGGFTPISRAAAVLVAVVMASSACSSTVTGAATASGGAAASPTSTAPPTSTGPSQPSIDGLRWSYDKPVVLDGTPMYDACALLTLDDVRTVASEDKYSWVMSLNPVPGLDTSDIDPGYFFSLADGEGTAECRYLRFRTTPPNGVIGLTVRQAPIDAPAARTIRSSEQHEVAVSQIGRWTVHEEVNESAGSYENILWITDGGPLGVELSFGSSRAPDRTTMLKYLAPLVPLVTARMEQPARRAVAQYSDPVPGAVDPCSLVSAQVFQQAMGTTMNVTPRANLPLTPENFISDQGSGPLLQTSCSYDHTMLRDRSEAAAIQIDVDRYATPAIVEGTLTRHLDPNSSESRFANGVSTRLDADFAPLVISTPYLGDDSGITQNLRFQYGRYDVQVIVRRNGFDIGNPMDPAEFSRSFTPVGRAIVAGLPRV